MSRWNGSDSEVQYFERGLDSKTGWIAQPVFCCVGDISAAFHSSDVVLWRVYLDQENRK